MKRLLIILVGLIFSSAVFAQQSELLLYFKQSSSEIDSTYMDNAKTLDSLAALLSCIKNDPSFQLIRIEMSSSFSFEGAKKINERLKKERFEALQKIINTSVNLPDSLVVMQSNVPGWGILKNLVKESDMQYKMEVLDIIDNFPELVFKNGVLSDSRNKRLMDLKWGRPYLYMMENFFPYLRYAKISAEYSFDSSKTSEFIAEMPDNEIDMSGGGR